MFSLSWHNAPCNFWETPPYISERNRDKRKIISSYYSENNFDLTEPLKGSQALQGVPKPTLRTPTLNRSAIKGGH